MKVKKILVRCLHEQSNTQRRFVVTSKNPKFKWFKGSPYYEVIKEWEVEVI